MHKTNLQISIPPKRRRPHPSFQDLYCLKCGMHGFYAYHGMLGYESAKCCNCDVDYSDMVRELTDVHYTLTMWRANGLSSILLGAESLGDCHDTAWWMMTIMRDCSRAVTINQSGAALFRDGNCWFEHFAN